MSHKQCRIIITKKCNLHCSYCLMKNEELMATFKPATMEEILEKEYSAYCITGGEPLYNEWTINKMINLILTIRRNVIDTKIFVYTNGEFKMSKNAILLMYLTDGINVSAHKNIPYKKIKIMNMYCPVRVHRQDTKIDAKLIHFCATHKMALKIWHKDDCTTVPEDRFILEGGE